MTGNAEVTSYDAAHVLWKILDPTHVFPTEEGGGKTVGKRAQPTIPALSWVREESGWALVVADPTDIRSAQAALSVPQFTAGDLSEHAYDGSVLRLALVRTPSETTRCCSA